LGFKLNPEKCLFGVKEVEFLGHIISAQGIKPKPDKLETIQNLKAPRTLRELRGLLGTLGFYQNFVPGYATLTRPLSALLSQKEKFHWGPEHDVALTRVKQAFSIVSPLDYMDPENTASFTLITDASMTAIGAQLIRVDHSGRSTVISNVSRALSSVETRYSNTERELLAIVWALTRLEIIIANKPVSVQTDHAALVPILTGSVKKVSTTRVERLRQKLIRFLPAGIYLRYIPGKKNVADALSRPSGCKTCPQKQVLPAIPHQNFQGGGSPIQEDSTPRSFLQKKKTSALC